MTRSTPCPTTRQNRRRPRKTEGHGEEGEEEGEGEGERERERADRQTGKDINRQWKADTESEMKRKKTDKYRETET